MFKKPVRIKSNNQVKGSERKSVKDLFCKTFPDFPESEASSLLNNKKEPLNCLKLVTHSNELVHVYTTQKQPLFFILQEKLVLPSVFLLWKYADIVPSFTVHSPVFQFISQGADLMLPGVVTPPGGGSKYNRVNEGQVVSVILADNSAGVAVGLAAQSSFDMERANGKGKCVVVKHFYGDYLCSLEGSFCPALPKMGAPKWLGSMNADADFPPLTQPKNVVENSSELRTEEPEEVVEEEEKETDMDELLYQAFLTAIKYSKTLTLPVLLSNFFKAQMLPVCPSLDLKKTSYKKLKPFLEEMARDGLITIKELKKGVEAITDIHKTNARFNEFYLSLEDRPQASEPGQPEPQTVITETYVITGNVAPIFTPGGLTKGDSVDNATIKKLVTEYVKQHECQMSDNPRLVCPKTDLLRVVCKTQNPVAWEEVFEKVRGAMKPCFKVSSKDYNTVTNKGKITPITMAVSTRSGNKKVTLVDNLELFGINIHDFAKECQHGVAASTSIIPTPMGRKCDQLLVQGNQVVFVHNLLTGKYNIPKKYVSGLELAPKRKK